MSVVAAAVIGSAVVGGVASSYASSKAKKAEQKGTQAAVQAELEGTRMQINEIQRQFDYQTRILNPQVQQQFNAQRAYADLLGIGGPEGPGVPPEAQPGRVGHAGRYPGAAPVQREQPVVDQQRLSNLQEQLRNAEYQTTAGTGGEGTMRRRADARQQANWLRQQIAEIERPSLGAPSAAETPTMGAPGTSGVGERFRDPATGAFIDPNLDPTRLSEDTRLRESVMQNRLAAGDISQDEYNQYLRENRIAAGTPEEDLMIQRAGDVRLAEGAAGTGVYGDVFQESPGYAFQVEEMGRELDRRRSAGGANIGGRAMMEANRRAGGIAAQEYYNWAGGRERDLTRLGAAEAADIQRGDVAYQGYEQQRIQDISRQDVGYQDYLRRQQLDIGRMDTAASQEDVLRASEQQRQDQAYYNYLANVSGLAGFGGGPAQQAVGASQTAGAATGGAYGAQGGALSGLYANQGVSQANIAYARGAGINQAIQGGMQNYMTAGYAGANIPGFR